MRLALAALIALTAPTFALAAAPAPRSCVPPGAWVDPADQAQLQGPSLLARAAQGPAVLLGERHDSPADHRWQFQTLAGLHAHRSNVAVGLEMLPRSVQPALDRWSAGEIDEATLLRETRWNEVWGYDAELYLPILRFARMNRLPVVALNVDRDLVRRTGREGWAAVPPSAREGVGDPAPPLPAYREGLARIMAMHDGKARGDGDEGLNRFVEAQLVWDRAMAEAIAGAHRRTGAMVVAILGAGHVEHGLGVAHQLADLGLQGSTALLPWPGDRECAELRAGIADAVFGLDPDPAPAPRPRLGIGISADAGGLRVDTVEAGGLGEEAGLRPGDLLRAAAGRLVARPADLASLVRSVAPGTWLPLSVERGGRPLVLLVRFPPA
ncbi:ChaN family lipoprotein [Arenibaculum pallidiluteum]|uniref:ChaN family lipoprotein n=1 Tax=Arenibaculum pallidiluteum TaxID=2812559 RepID=UPI001A963058|nr:ChaN family lipoprotein [Arenibaculum pallidiluteum]